MRTTTLPWTADPLFPLGQLFCQPQCFGMGVLSYAYVVILAPQRYYFHNIPDPGPTTSAGAVITFSAPST